MKAIVNTGPNKLEFLDWPTPQPGPGQVRVRVGACAICATDLLMIAGWDRTSFPAIPGHEWAGTVDAVGEGVDAALAGRKCVSDNVQEDGGEVGFEHPGGYGQFLLTRASNVRTLGPQTDLSAATLIEPTAVCCRAIARLTHGGRDNDLGRTLILGDGSIGLIFTAMLCSPRMEPKLAASEVTLVGGHDRRLELARSLRPDVKTLNYHKLGGQGHPDTAEGGCATGGCATGGGATDLVASLRSPAPGRFGSFDTIIEATGSASAIDACPDLAAREARVLVLGDYRDHRAKFPWLDLLHRELEIIGSNAGAGGWDSAVALAQSGALPLEKFVTHTLPAEKFQDAFALVRGRNEDVIKVVLRWE